MEKTVVVLGGGIGGVAAAREVRRRYNGFGACFLEVGSGKAAYARGNFYAEPTPGVKLRRSGRLWHWIKVFVEKRWLRRWF